MMNELMDLMTNADIRNIESQMEEYEQEYAEKVGLREISETKAKAELKEIEKRLAYECIADQFVETVFDEIVSVFASLPDEALRIMMDYYDRPDVYIHDVIRSDIAEAIRGFMIKDYNGRIADEADEEEA